MYSSRLSALALAMLWLGGCGAADEASVPSVTGDAFAMSCFGTSTPLVLSNGLPYASGRVNEVTDGMFLIDLATTGSTIDLDAFDIRPTAHDCDANRIGVRCVFDSLDLFGARRRVAMRTTDDSSVHGSVRQAGILGTDLMSGVAITLDYAGGRSHHATRDTFCNDAELDATGLLALDTAGFYASDPSTLLPLSDVATDANEGRSVPNVPTVPVRLAGTAAVAQLDTGFDDSLVPFSVNVNEALFDAATRAKPNALVRTPSLDLALTTCAGVAERVEAYTLAPGETFEVGALGGWSNATVFVKRTPPAARVCGGIGTWSTPAAQIGSSFFADFGVVVFDPFTSRVWAKKHRS